MNLCISWHGPQRVVLALLQLVKKISGKDFTGGVAAELDALALGPGLAHPDPEDVGRPIQDPDPHEVIDGGAGVAEASVVGAFEVDNLEVRGNSSAAAPRTCRD